MRTLVLAVFLASCATVEPAKPRSEPVDVQIAARTGFLLQQIALRDEQIDDQKEMLNRLEFEAGEATKRRQELVRNLNIATDEIQRLNAEVASRDEMIRLRSRQIVAAFSKGSGQSREVEILTSERDTCYIQLAEAMIPLPVKKAAAAAPPPASTALPIPAAAPNTRVQGVGAGK
jgi:hypothetical protein